MYFNQKIKINMLNEIVMCNKFFRQLINTDNIQKIAYRFYFVIISTYNWYGTRNTSYTGYYSNNIYNNNTCKYIVEIFK